MRGQHESRSRLRVWWATGLLAVGVGSLAAAGCGSPAAKDQNVGADMTCWTGTIVAATGNCPEFNFRSGGALYHLTGNVPKVTVGETVNLAGTLKGPSGTCELSVIDVTGSC